MQDYTRWRSDKVVPKKPFFAVEDQDPTVDNGPQQSWWPIMFSEHASESVEAGVVHPAPVDAVPSTNYPLMSQELHRVPDETSGLQ